MISIKKLLSDNEAEEALARATRLLLQGISLHAVEGAAADYARFRTAIDRVESSFENAIAPAEVLGQTGIALKALEEYNRRTAAYLRLPAMELQEMVRMLTATVGAIAVTGDEGLVHLRDLERQMESAAQVEDVRVVKLKLAQCLNGIREESERQRTENSRTVEQLRHGLERASKGHNTTIDGVDPVTDLPARLSAEDALANAGKDENNPAFALAVQVDRIQVFNARFGYEVGDQILRHYAAYLREQLPPPDRIFRWTGPILVALLPRNNRYERVRTELARIMEHKYEHTVQTASRTVLLPISARWALFPISDSPVLVGRKIDSFANYQNPRET